MSAKGRLEIQCLHVSRIKGTIDTFPAGLLCQYLRKYCKFSTKPLLGLSNKRSRPVVRFFLLEGATLWPNEAGGISLGGGRGEGMLGCLRLRHHSFEKHGYFWSLGIAQSFKLQKWFFFFKESTVNSLYSGHCQDLELLSSLSRVHNSGTLFQSNICNLSFPGICFIMVSTRQFRRKTTSISLFRKKIESSKSLLFARFAAWSLHHHDLLIVCQAQVSFGAS